MGHPQHCGREQLANFMVWESLNVNSASATGAADCNGECLSEGGLVWQGMR